MTSIYKAPVEEITFVLNKVLNIKELFDTDKFRDFSEELVDAIITEAAKFVDQELAPLNIVGDKNNAVLKNGVVTTAPGFKEAYEQFVTNGWNSIASPVEYGGQGVPQLVSLAISEMVSGANMAFGLCPMLTQGAIELLLKHGDNNQKEKYLRQLVSGQYTGTMCLTEPQAGSDLGAIKTTAIKNYDHYLIKGQKIFITYGDHDYTDNIIHMVLARTAPQESGIKGISLFVVPKILSDGKVNDIKSISIEHKLGIHASPTLVLNFGDEKGAVGYLVGDENKGVEYMFTMMNNARLAVGVEGVGLAENSLQKATDYASERVQFGKAISLQPDIERTLLTMRSWTEAMRLLSYMIAKAIDLSESHKDKDFRQQNRDVVDLLIPVIKFNATEAGFLMSSEAMQVFGGMGYIEETAIAQNLRDSRIAMIYEGTNGIQAMDLVFRKIFINEGRLIDSNSHFVSIYIKNSSYEQIISEAYNKLMQTTILVRLYDKEKLGFIAGYYTRMFGIVMGGVMMALSEKSTREEGVFFEQKAKTIKFYMQYILPEINYLKECIEK